jgi:hypothetical protein
MLIELGVDIRLIKVSRFGDSSPLEPEINADASTTAIAQSRNRSIKILLIRGKK